MTTQELLSAAKAGVPVLSRATEAQKNSALRSMANALEARADAILAANKLDLEAARENGMSEAMLDRLSLNENRIKGMADGIRQVAAQTDPVGRVLEGSLRPNGLKIEKLRVPLGVIGMIYEARPNVTADAAALCLKAGNAVILRGGKEAIHSNRAIADTLREAVSSAGLPKDSADGFRRSLDAVATLNPANITVHTLALKKGADLFEKRENLPSAGDVAEMVAYAEKTLRALGYKPYYLYRQKYMSGSFENVGWTKPGGTGLYNIYIMEELHSILSLGAGGSTKMVGGGQIRRAFNAKYPREYIDRPEKRRANLMDFARFYAEQGE